MKTPLKMMMCSEEENVNCLMTFVQICIYGYYNDTNYVNIISFKTFQRFSENVFLAGSACSRIIFFCHGDVIKGYVILTIRFLPHNTLSYGRLYLYSTSHECCVFNCSKYDSFPNSIGIQIIAWPSETKT